MDALEITFNGGHKLHCRGTLFPSEGELRGNGDSETFTEVCDTVQFWIEEGEIRAPTQILPLYEGLYLINKDGLWKSVSNGGWHD